MAKKKKKKAADPLAAALAQVRESAVNDAVANILNRDGNAAPSLVTNPNAIPGSVVGVGPQGPADIAEAAGEGGFLGGFLPILLALGAGAAAYFWLDWGIWWSLGVAVLGYVVIKVGAAFLGG